MSELRRLVIGAAAAACLAGPLGAQDADSLRRSIDARQARLEIVNRLYARADSLHILERLARDAEPLDSALVGPFLVVAPSDVMARARAEFESAWRKLEPLLGEAVAQLEPWTFLVSAGRTVPVYAVLARRDAHRQVNLAPPWAPRVGDPAHSALTGAIARTFPREVRGWSAGARILDLPNWPAIHRALALSPAGRARRCFEGDMAACRSVLTATYPGVANERWYTAEQIRAFALRRRGASTTLRQQCEEGRQEACLLHLDRLGGAPPPVGGSTRASLAYLALERGGEGSLARLLADSAAPMTGRLERAAGVPVDELVRAWHARVTAARPATSAGLGTTTVSALIIVAFLLLIARRSSRWRIG